jgi:hypothetical protein
MAVVSASEMARHLDVTREQLNRLTSQGVIERRGDKKFDVDANRLKYIRHLRQKPTQASALIEARTKLTELRTAKLRNELMDVRACQSYLVTTFVEPMLSGLAAIPSAFCGRDLKERRRLEAMINKVRNDTCDRCDREADALKKSMKDDEAA